MDVEALSVSELLGGYAQILAELRRRKVVRTNNAPVGDYAELLVATAVAGELASNLVEKSFDLIAPMWGKVQVKARTVTIPVSASHAQTSPFRSWDFDHAALVQVQLTDYSVHRAVMVTVDDIRAASVWKESLKGWVAHMRGDLMDGPRAVDITAQVRSAAESL